MVKRKNKKKKKLIIGIISVLLIGGVAFGVTKLFDKKDNSLENKVDNKESKKDNKIEEPKVKIVDVNSKSRPYAVMINNIGAARPYHIGLQKAYLVYEIIVEGGITRYMALFKDNLPEIVGSVRSARHYYLDYALENDAYYVHWGWSPQAQSDISTLKVNNLNGLSSGSPYFFRKKYDANISSEHTGYTNLKEMANLVDKKGYRTETNKAMLLKYSAKAIDLSSNEDVIDANNIDLKYSNSYVTNYVYDSTNKVYKQFVNDKEHVDYDTTEQYTVKNIITYQVSNKSISGDDKGRQDIDNIGNGEGYYITEGKAVPITWEKSSRSAQTVYKYKDGTKITVNDGNTWIHIVPTSGDIGIS
ncbi:MAG: DUF3048 domain-containing protein [Ruminococcus sp.]|nr:DUF3048 domain-containing protein [Ruminococcus sp.]